MHSKKTILVCPLNWGLGHATRMIPVIDSLIAEGHTVIVASDGNALKLLQKRYPSLQSITLPNLSIRYGTGLFAPFLFMSSIPNILRWIGRDRRALHEICKQINIDIVISDNRWGLWNKSVKSIFVTHQVMVKMPKLFSFLEKPIFHIQQRFIARFDELWIPDVDDKSSNLSGDLSHKYSSNIPTKYIGILSQFSLNSVTEEQIYDVAVILSGPEPHRSILEKLLLEKFGKMPLKTIVVAGKSGSKTIVDTKNTTYISFANTEELQHIFNQSKYIVCRSGYTSVMDIVTLRKKAIIIPTPSQTEQEYLGKYLSQKGWFITVPQNKIDSISLQMFDALEKIDVSDNTIVNTYSDLFRKALESIQNI